MKVSVVTISFNQVDFIERTIRSVIEQEGVDIEYIVVDPGSTDGSRDVIEKYRPRISHIIYDPDRGAADGLNKGFAKATGDIFYYLNSDDTIEAGALKKVIRTFEERPDVDVLCGHAWIVDENDGRIRRVWSDPFIAPAFAHGLSIQIQPSTFIRAEAFRRSGGFNVENRSNWDGELIVDLARTGAKIEIINDFLSGYRLHSSSITASGSEDKKIQAWKERCFKRIKNRAKNRLDVIDRVFWFTFRQLRNPAAFMERLTRGPVYRRMAK